MPRWLASCSGRTVSSSLLERPAWRLPAPVPAPRSHTPESSSPSCSPGEHPDHVVVIKYVPYVADSKRAMDEVGGWPGVVRAPARQGWGCVRYQLSRVGEILYTAGTKAGRPLPMLPIFGRQRAPPGVNVRLATRPPPLQYTSEIFLGGRNTIVMHNTCEVRGRPVPLLLAGRGRRGRQALWRHLARFLRAMC